jgi:hypothetical protein
LREIRRVDFSDVELDGGGRVPVAHVLRAVFSVSSQDFVDGRMNRSAAVVDDSATMADETDHDDPASIGGGGRRRFPGKRSKSGFG